MDSAAWFHAFINRCHQRRSVPSPQAWVGTHDVLQDSGGAVGAAIGARKLVGALVTHSARNDARTVATVSGSGVDVSFPPDSSSIDDYNIFADLSLHDQAAATIARASQKRSGFTIDMSMDDGVAVESFRAYLQDFVAPHWLLTYYNEVPVRHHETNHVQFVNDLVTIIVEVVRRVGADEEAVQKVEESVRSLAKRLSSQTRREEKLTLFLSFWMDRPNSTDPVKYGIFYTTLDAAYEENGKTEVLTATVNTFSVFFTLLSGVLIQYQSAYNALPKSSVDDWLSSHEI